jgi:hypothetical protein
MSLEPFARLLAIVFSSNNYRTRKAFLLVEDSQKSFLYTPRYSVEQTARIYQMLLHRCHKLGRQALALAARLASPPHS